LDQGYLQEVLDVEFLFTDKKHIEYLKIKVFIEVSQEKESNIFGIRKA
jgi:hypothetical protein